MKSILSYCTLAISYYCISSLLQVTAKVEGISRSSPCKIFPNNKGTCVNLQKCEYFVKLLRENPNAGRRIIYQSRCSSNIFNLKVCCPEDQRNYPQPGTTEAPTSHLLLPPQCGFSNKAHDRVVGGNPSVPGAWPWIASIGFAISLQQIGFGCGGALISSRHVITAAHCVYGMDPRVVRLGEHDFANNNDEAFDILVEKATTHPRYNRELGENDIAILKLKENVQFTDAVHPICLPVSNEIKNRDLVGYYPFVAGWGALHYDGPESSILREVQVPVVDNEQCRKIYRDFDDVVIDDRVICAGYTRGGKDACQGDSGGPLMYPVNSSYYLIGVVSSGYKCAEPGFPGIYTRVTSFLDFILSHME